MESKLANSDVVTMQDILDDEKELQDQASAVLSGSDEKNCNGISKRQALYSCLTCSPPEVRDDFSLAIGVCLACSLQCHEKHELIELYTKRNFHCDCGVKSGSVKCQLDPTKTLGSNEKSNKYNQNFSGVYCICHRPYPDPEDTVQDEMIQCIVCEDWFHSLHLNAKVPAAEAYAEMICGFCMEKNEFLADYNGQLGVVAVADETGNDSTLNVTSLNESALAETENAPEAKKMKLADDACVRPKVENSTYVKGSATFWRSVNWRNELCKCSACVKIYEDLGVTFLTDFEDSTQFYEMKGKNSGEQQTAYMASMEALSSLPRTNQIDAITGYNRMKDKLFEFLQTFVQNNQIVTEEDIQRFFRNMKDSNDNKPVQQPHFCR